jgi:hypothetical protein
MRDDDQFVTILRMNSSLIKEECTIYNEQILTFFDCRDYVELKKQEISVKKNYRIEFFYIYYNAIFLFVVNHFSDDEDRVAKEC